MKKLYLLMLVFLVALILSACQTNTQPAPSAAPTEAPAVKTEVKPTEAPAEVIPTEAPTEEQSEAINDTQADVPAEETADTAEVPAEEPTDTTATTDEAPAEETADTAEVPAEEPTDTTAATDETPAEETADTAEVPAEEPADTTAASDEALAEETADTAEVPAEEPADTTAVTDEAPAEEIADVAETEAETAFDPESSKSVIAWYKAHGQEMFKSHVYSQSDADGNQIWTAPLAGITEFEVPESFTAAKGGIRPAGGEEIIPGSGIVTMEFKYIPSTEEEYNKLIEEVSRAEESGDEKTLQKNLMNYYSNVATLFTVIGIQNNGKAEDFKEAYRKINAGLGVTEEELQPELDGMEFIPAGAADGFNFYMMKSPMDAATAFQNDKNREYKEEYDELSDNLADYVFLFTFAKPLALGEPSGQE